MESRGFLSVFDRSDRFVLRKCPYAVALSDSQSGYAIVQVLISLRLLSSLEIALLIMSFTFENFLCCLSMLSSGRLKQI